MDTKGLFNDDPEFNKVVDAIWAKRSPEQARAMFDDLNERYRIAYEKLLEADAKIKALTGALWNSTRNMQDIVKYGEKACNEDFKHAIERNLDVLNPK